VLLCAAAGLTFGLAVPSAFADDPPPTTVPTPTLPAPDPAPPKPKPKPVSHPAPRTVRTTPVYHAPTPAPVVPSSSATRPTVHTHVKPKKKVRQKKAVVKKKAAPTTTTATLPTVTVLTTAGAVGVPSVFHSKSGGGGSSDLGSIVIVLGLSIAIACFAVALVPATSVKWRPAAIFVSERQVDLTITGLGLLVVAAFTFFLTKGS
jgi:hypothetical protein